MGVLFCPGQQSQAQSQFYRPHTPSPSQEVGSQLSAGWETISEPRFSGGDQTPEPTVTTRSSEEVTTSRWLTISIKRNSREYFGRNPKIKFICLILLRPT